MDIKKISSKLSLILLLVLTSVFSSCKKEVDQESVINIRCITPHNNHGVAGCKVTVTEIKQKKFDSSVTGSPEGEVMNTYTGVTDASGNARITFHYKKKKSRYFYTISYDYSGIQQPEGMGSIEIVTPKGWANYLDQNQYNYNFEFNVLGLCAIHTKLTNVNCYDEYDSVEYTLANLSANEGLSSNYWLIPNFGCGILQENNPPYLLNKRTGVIVYKSRITRNDVSYFQYDTFNLQPNVINEVFIEY